MHTDELDFVLPPELIAQTPPPLRESSRLLHYRREDHSIAHRTFSDLPSLLKKGDLLVFNDARVIAARFTLRKSTGGRIEGLFLQEARPGEWKALLKNAGPITDSPLSFPDFPEVAVRIEESLGAGEFRLTIDPPYRATDVLDRVGRMPLPPYIKRAKDHDDRDNLDRLRYQTIFAKTPGAVAAPTAALHFSPPVFAELEAAGVAKTFVTLHVGMGTFRPVTADTLQSHTMHVESYSISAEAAEALNQAKSQNRRIIAIGTTAARVLESQPADMPFIAKDAETGIFIYPPYQWKHVAAMVTNFHLPRSTLIALVAAMTGLEEQRRLYILAIELGYRFFSYGDAMFIE